MTEIHSGHKRGRHPVFRSWDRQKVDAAVDGLFKLIRDANAELFVLSCILFGHTAADLAAIKRRTYMALLCETIYGLTGRNVSPTFIFDAEKI